MSAIQPAMRISNHPAFNRRPFLGFEVGTDPAEKVSYIHWRYDPGYDDWQEERRMPGFEMANGRTTYQNLQNGDMVLTTGAWFRSWADYQRFLALSQQRGMLRMDADFTMHRDYSRAHTERVKVLAGRAYAEFDNVRITEVVDQTFDNDGGVRCMVTYTRPWVLPDGIAP